MVEHDIPAMVHVSTSCNACFHTTGAHYLNADTTAFMQCLTSDLFKDFPTLRFVIPHGGGAVPYHWGRFRGLAQEMKKPLLQEHLLNNIFFDTCVYHQPGIDLLTRVIPVDNILFAQRDDRRCARHRPRDRPLLRRHEALHRRVADARRRLRATRSTKATRAACIPRLDARAQSARAAETMESTAMNHLGIVKRNIVRADAAAVEHLSRFGSATVHEAHGPGRPDEAATCGRSTPARMPAARP